MNKWLLSVLAVVLSALQAWDSHALAAEWFVQMIIVAAMLLPATAIAASAHAGVRFAAVGAAAALLLLARLVSATPLPELVLAAVFPGILLLFDRFRTMQTHGASRTDS